MFTAIIASLFGHEIICVANVILRYQQLAWLKWGLKLFPFIMMHEDEEGAYAVTFTIDEFWERRFAKSLNDEELQNVKKDKEI